MFLLNRKEWWNYCVKSLRDNTTRFCWSTNVKKWINNQIHTVAERLCRQIACGVTATQHKRQAVHSLHSTLHNEINEKQPVKSNYLAHFIFNPLFMYRYSHPKAFILSCNKSTAYFFWQSWNKNDFHTMRIQTCKPEQFESSIEAKLWNFTDNILIPTTTYLIHKTLCQETKRSVYPTECSGGKTEPVTMRNEWVGVILSRIITKLGNTFAVCLSKLVTTNATAREKQFRLKRKHKNQPQKSQNQTTHALERPTSNCRNFTQWISQHCILRFNCAMDFLVAACVFPFPQTENTYLQKRLRATPRN